MKLGDRVGTVGHGWVAPWNVDDAVDPDFDRVLIPNIAPTPMSVLIMSTHTKTDQVMIGSDRYRLDPVLSAVVVPLYHEVEVMMAHDPDRRIDFNMFSESKLEAEAAELNHRYGTDLSVDRFRNELFAEVQSVRSESVVDATRRLGRATARLRSLPPDPASSIHLEVSFRNDALVREILLSGIGFPGDRAGELDSVEELPSHARSGIDAACRYLSDHLGESINLNELVSLTALNRSYFYKGFKQFTGLTPLEYLNRLKLDRAKMLLTKTPKSIFEIALECGFAGESTFIRFFGRALGMPPGKYRSYTRK